MTDARLFGNAVAHNAAPILAELRRILPSAGLVLEIASGSGEHVAAFARALPGLDFQPTDRGVAELASIDAWAAGLPNVRPASLLDAAGPWPAMAVDAVLCINMIHIAPWAAAIGLLRGASQVLRPGGVLVLYGPFLRDGMATAPGNIAFDADLRGRNPDWGVRRLEDVTGLAASFAPPEVTEMPANNLIVAFRRPG